MKNINTNTEVRIPAEVELKELIKQLSPEQIQIVLDYIDQLEK